MTMHCGKTVRCRSCIIIGRRYRFLQGIFLILPDKVRKSKASGVLFHSEQKMWAKAMASIRANVCIPYTG